MKRYIIIKHAFWNLEWIKKRKVKAYGTIQELGRIICQIKILLIIWVVFGTFFVCGLTYIYINVELISVKFFIVFICSENPIVKFPIESSDKILASTYFFFTSFASGFFNSISITFGVAVCFFNCYYSFKNLKSSFYSVSSLFC